VGTVRAPVVVFVPAFPINLTPLWVALDKGFFREEGLEVEVAAVFRAPGEHPRFQWRREGRLVFASPCGSGPFRSILEGRDRSDQEINVLSVARHTAHVLVVRPEIADHAALRGRRIGADFKGGSGIDAKIALRHFGVDPAELTWVDSRGQPPDTERYRLALFDRGELDAVCCDPPHWNEAVAMGGRRLTSARDLLELPEAGIGTSPEVIERHPDVVRGMVRAVLRGVEFARQNREETLDCVLRHDPRMTRERAAEVWTICHDDWVPPTTPGPYERKVEIYTREWNLPPRPIHAYYNFTFLKEAMHDLRLLRSWDPALDAAPAAV
jgi:ABC-type nitrate/sulfonate/bicarbonate transport system substrate-binding protein